MGKPEDSAGKVIMTIVLEIIFMGIVLKFLLFHLAGRRIDFFHGVLAAIGTKLFWEFLREKWETER